MKISKLSVSNILLTLTCLISMIAVIMLNLENTKHLASIRANMDSLMFENPNAQLLQEADKKLSVAENNYRIYLSTNDTVYKNIFLHGVAQVLENIQHASLLEDSLKVKHIDTSFHRKMILANLLFKLKRFSDSISVYPLRGGINRFAFNSPIKLKNVDKSIIESFIISRVDTLKSVPKKKKGFFKKVGDLFSKKEEETILQHTSGIDIKRKIGSDSSVLNIESDSSISKFSETILRFYQDDLDREIQSRRDLNMNEIRLAEANLHIISEVNQVLSDLLKREIKVKTDIRQAAFFKLLNERETIRQTAIKSLIIILVIICFLVFSIIRADRYEKKLLAETLKAQRLAAVKTRFMSNISHEIRSPLTAIMGFGDVLYEIENDPEKRKYLMAIKKSSEHLLHTVNDVLDFSKLEAGKMQINNAPFNLFDTLDDIKFSFSKIAEDKGVTIRWELDMPRGIKLLGDKFRLNQIIYNLVSNAIKFSENGEVMVTIKVIIQGERVLLDAHVIDNGIGIPADRLDDIFEEFAQVPIEGQSKLNNRMVRGTGLGLPICKMLIEMQDGSINVKSKIHEGSDFHFQISYALVQEFPGSELGYNDELNQMPIKESINSFKDKKALVVEDNELNVMLLSLFLKKYALPFDVAHDGNEAIKKFTQSDYDIILTDINLPMLNGDELASIIRGNYNSLIPIVGLTASILEDDVQKYLNAGLSAILAKPFKEVELAQLLQKYLSN